MGPYPSGDAALRNPTTGIADCCARAARGHAIAATLSAPMNSRLRMWAAMRPSRGEVMSMQRRRQYHALAKYEQCFCVVKVCSRPRPVGGNSGALNGPPYVYYLSADITGPSE